MTLEDRLERLAARTPPGDPADVLSAARHRAEDNRGGRGGSPRLLAAAAAVIAVVALAAGAFVLTSTDRDTVTVAGPDGPASLDGQWLLTATVTDNEIRTAQAQVFVTVNGDTVSGDDGCGNAVQAELSDGRVAYDGFHSLAGCPDEPGSYDANRFWHVIEQQPRYEVRERELWLLSDSGDALVFVRSDRVAPAAPRVLPGSVPVGYRLAWVDTPVQPPADQTGTPLHERAHDYAYGYQTDGAELEVRVLVGATIGDAEAVADEWGPLTRPTAVGGNPAVRITDDSGYTRMLVQVDGGVVMVSTHPLGASFPDGPNPAVPPATTVEQFAASIGPVSDDEWDDALASSGADVASTFGPKDGVAVVDGDGWSLVHGEFRAPLSVRHAALWIDFGRATGGAAGSGVLGENAAWHVAIAVHDSTRVAWGILPAGAATVEVTIDGQVYTVGTVALADTAERAFAVDVSRSTGNGTFQATGPSGGHVASGPVDIE